MLDAFDCTLSIWLPVGGNDNHYESFQWKTTEEMAIKAVDYLSAHRVPCEAKRETVEIVSADYAGFTKAVEK